MSLRVTPCTLGEAKAFVEQQHRHHGPPVGGLFAIAASSLAPGLSEPQVVGVVIVGRPVARGLDDGWTVEVTRLATDGSRNACSLLYGAAWRAAKALGYRKLVTYTLLEEGGASLRAVGFERAAVTKGGSWDTPSRPRVDKHPTQQKIRWEVSS